MFFLIGPCVDVLLFGVPFALQYSVAHSLPVTRAALSQFYSHPGMYLFVEEQRVARTSVALMPNMVNNMF